MMILMTDGEMKWRQVGYGTLISLNTCDQLVEPAISHCWPIYNNITLSSFIVITISFSFYHYYYYYYFFFFNYYLLYWLQRIYDVKFTFIIIYK